MIYGFPHRPHTQHTEQLSTQVPCRKRITGPYSWSTLSLWLFMGLRASLEGFCCRNVWEHVLSLNPNARCPMDWTYCVRQQENDRSYQGRIYTNAKQIPVTDQKNFAHVMTVTLLWCMENFIVIGRVQFKPEHDKFWSNFEFDQTIVSDMGACMRVRFPHECLHWRGSMCSYNMLSPDHLNHLFPQISQLHILVSFVWNRFIRNLIRS